MAQARCGYNDSIPGRSKYFSERTWRNKSVFVGGMAFRNDSYFPNPMVMSGKRSLRLESSHDLETSEQLPNDCLSSQGR